MTRRQPRTKQHDPPEAGSGVCRACAQPVGIEGIEGLVLRFSERVGNHEKGYVLISRLSALHRTAGKRAVDEGLLERFDSPDGLAYRRTNRPLPTPDDDLDDSDEENP